jgi:DNA mismatch repair protein MutS
MLDYFGVKTLEGFGLSKDGPVGHIGALVGYIQETHKDSAPVLKPPQDITRHEYMLLDANALHNLEILDEAGRRGKPGGLLTVLDDTVTAIGKRTVRAWLTRPSTDAELLRRKHDVVEFLVREQDLNEQIRLELRSVQDLERLTGKVDAGRATPRDAGAIGRSLAAIPRVKGLIEAATAPKALAELGTSLDPLAELRDRIAASLVDEPPVKENEGEIFRDGFHDEIDRLRALRNNVRDWLVQYRNSEVKRTGISNLKVAYNRVFGYYIEVSKGNVDKVPQEYERRQTLANAERYTTHELKKHEDEVLNAEERLRTLEATLFAELREFARGYVKKLRFNASALGTLDCLAGFAEIARRRRYVRPKLLKEPVINVKGGRHPVVEARISAGEFVPNDTLLTGNSEQIIVLTGPNMAGKSTYIRQVALIAVMAQAGSFIPADEAELGVFDRIFARVGASDDILGGRSTFMVEMVETAVILNNATSHSLVILDEVGRGTSTFDGLSLAWAIVEFLHENGKERPLTLFATHYHELTAMAQEFRRIRNYNVAVKDWQGEVVFLHRIVPGGMDRSYGIHVARIAGIPERVVTRAGEILDRLEEHAEELRDEALAGNDIGAKQLSLFIPVKSEVEKELVSLDVERMAPVDALKTLAELRQKALKNLGKA